MTDREIENFDAEIRQLRQAGEEILLIEITPHFLGRLAKARPSARLDLTSENNTYKETAILLSEDIEDYQFHIAFDDDKAEWEESSNNN